MKFTGSRTIKLSALRLPGDIARRRKAPHVKELAASIKANGLAHLPVVDSTFSPVVGRDRIAALLELGHKTTEVRTVEGTADELEALEIAENLHRRRDDVDEMRSRYVAVMERQLVEVASTNSPLHRDVGRPATPRGQAINEAAKQEGVTPRAVRDSLARVEAKAAEVEEPEEPEQTDPVEMWGLRVDGREQEFAQVRQVQEVLRAADTALKAALRAVASLKDGPKICEIAYYRVRQGVQLAADTVRRSIPTHLCPYCKGMKNRTPKCTGCAGTAYTGGDIADHIGPELKRRGMQAMVIDGKGGFTSIYDDKANAADREGDVL